MAERLVYEWASNSKMPNPILLNNDMHHGHRAIEVKKYGLVVSGDVQTIFSYMSGARFPPVDAHMSTQDACMLRSLTEVLRCLLKVVDG